MGEFTLPSNIKQIGSIGDGLRIYMEDYVCTYLFQYAESGGYDERIALLVGRYMVIDGQGILFINGAIQGKDAEEKDGLMRFTEKTGEYADAMIDEYFRGMEIVGWMQSQPSYGVYLNQQYAAYHMREFSKEYQVLFVMDPMEKINTFYTMDAERNALKEVKGYFIYYDKNKNMHEYMLKNKVTEYTAQTPAYIELPRTEHTGDGMKSGYRGEKSGKAEKMGKLEKLSKLEKLEKPENQDKPEGPGALERSDKPGYSAGPSGPEDIIRKHQEARARKRSVTEQRRTMNLLVSLSAVLFIVCFVMGAGLIRNQDRITQMEDQLVQLSTAYRDSFILMNPSGTAAVFASQADAATGQETDLPESTATGQDIGQSENQPVETATEQGTNLPEDTQEGLSAEESISTPTNDTSGSTGGNNATEASGGVSGNDAAEANVSETAASPEPEPIPVANQPGQVIEENAENNTQPAASTETSAAESTVSTASSGNEQTTALETYTIQPGDSLIAICLRFYGDTSKVDEILALNGLENADKIISGKTLQMPRK